MKRRLLALMLVPALLALSGCHGTRGRRAFEVPEAFDASRSYEITFWAKNDTNKTQTAIYQQAIESFQALYPGITVTMRLYTDYGKIYNDVITNIATDTTPNVCITYPDHIATYLTGDNVVAPLDALMDDPAYGLGGSEIAFDAPTRDEIVPEYLAECSFGGHTYALPFMRSTEACYVNQDMVEALGYELPDVLTWDFLWEVADRAAEKDADGVYRLNGQQVMIPVIYKSTDNMMIQLLARAIPTATAMCCCSATRRRRCCSPSPIRCGRARSPRSRFPAIPPISSTPASACSPSTPPRAPHGWARTRR